MIEVTFYNNGFEINGHADVVICYQVSILSWACANTMSMNNLESDYYTSDYDKSDVGYTYLTFEVENEKSMWVFNEFKTNITHWKDAYWTDEEVKLSSKDETLLIPINFKELKGIQERGDMT